MKGTVPASVVKAQQYKAEPFDSTKLAVQGLRKRKMIIKLPFKMIFESSEYHCLQKTMFLLGIHDNISPYPEWPQTLRVPECLLKFWGGNISAIRRGEFKAITDHSWPFTPHKTRARIPASSFG